jgi:hypothetical protein
MPRTSAPVESGCAVRNTAVAPILGDENNQPMSIFRPHRALVARPPSRRRPHALDDDICVHIFTSSSVMVGVCLTVVGMLRVAITLRAENTLADDLLAINAMMYLLSAVLSYGGLRTRSTQRNHRLEYTADAVFISGLVFTVINTGFITWAIAVA